MVSCPCFFSPTGEILVNYYDYLNFDSELDLALIGKGRIGFRSTEFDLTGV